MVLHARTEACEGVRLMAEAAGGFGVTVGLAVPVVLAEKSVFVEAIALAAEPIPPPHPQPQSARAIRKTKNRKNSDL